MISLKLLRSNPEIVRTSLLNRGYPVKPLEDILTLDGEWRKEKAAEDGFRAERNALSLEISDAKKKGVDAGKRIERTKELSDGIKKIGERTETLEEKMRGILLEIPNIHHESIPVGPDSGSNLLIREWETGKRKTSKDVLPHYEIGEKLDILDFKRGVKLAGSRFVVLKGIGARLERALINFMLETAIERGYTEIFPPLLVNRKTMTGTGQLPKFEAELYTCEMDDYWLIPTAEVPLTNLYADEILKEEQLPINVTAYTPCFRREAGAYGKDIKGIIRQHQFNKVELVKFATPETSYDELEKLTADAEYVLRRLGLPYKVISLSTGDLGFSASKTYDIEVWVPSQDKYREISSCSNCTDFQARRANIRYWHKGKPEFVHTLNGSGVAVGRTMVAIMENFQDESGINIPEPLQDFMRLERIEFK